jgi:hypothetical protein
MPHAILYSKITAWYYVLGAFVGLLSRVNKEWAIKLKIYLME